jgi:hypothetical protein
MFTNKKFMYKKAGEPMTPAPGYTMAQQRAAAGDRALAMRDAYSNGIRCKGFTVTINPATGSYSVDLSGMAKNFLGFAWFFPSAISGIIIEQLVINNDVVVDSTLIQHHQVQNTTNDRDYYAFPRPLNGQDTIVFNFNSSAVAAQTAYLVVYYI